MKLVTISKLKVGQKFRWIPNAWFGTGKLLSKHRRKEFKYVSEKGFTFVYLYDLKYDARVVNPPALDYGIPGTTKVELIKRKKK